MNIFDSTKVFRNSLGGQLVEYSFWQRKHLIRVLHVTCHYNKNIAAEQPGSLM